MSEPSARSTCLRTLLSLRRPLPMGGDSGRSGKQEREKPPFTRQPKRGSMTSTARPQGFCPPRTSGIHLFH
eukprot:2100498-Pyramimonas_sp.AAC.1